jgi:hypothetical protein
MLRYIENKDAGALGEILTLVSGGFINAERNRFMLELRPSCENCNQPLPPDALEARICTYECTFCADCVTRVLENVCPNCGGGFVQRPVRPARNWKNNNFLGNDPAGTQTRFRPVDRAVHAAFAAQIKDIPPERR